MNLNDLITIPVGDVLLTEEGIVLICHLLGCNNCSGWGAVYVNMSLVDQDTHIREIICPGCRQETLYLITYSVEEKMREIQEEIEDDTQENGSDF